MMQQVVSQRHDPNNSSLPQHNRGDFVYGPFSPSGACNPMRDIHSILEASVRMTKSHEQILTSMHRIMDQLNDAVCSLGNYVKLLGKRVHKLERHKVANHISLHGALGQSR